MAGLNAEEAVGSIGDVLNLAGAGALSLEQSASYLTGAVKGFNDEMANSAYYADLMAKGATMANTDVDALGAALSGAAASANAYGQSAESTTLALLRLAEQNVTGSEAATAMNRAMADLYTPTDQAATALEELGIKTFEANGDARDFNVVVDDLNARLAEMSQEERLAYESTIFTTFGMKAFQKMTVSTTEKVEQFSAGLREASGSAMQQYATQTDNLEGKMAILNSALEALGIQIYDIFSETLKGSVGEGTEAIERLQEAVAEGELGESLEHLSESFSDLVETVIEIGEEALPVLVDGLALFIDYLPAIIGGIAGVKVAQIGYEAATIASTIATEGFNAVLMANPIGLIIGAVGALAGALIGLSTTFEGAGTAAELAEQDLQGYADTVGKAMDSMKESVEGANTSLKDISNSSGYIDSLKNELATLQDVAAKQGLNAEQKKRAVDIVKILNKELSGLNIIINEETGVVEGSTEEWLGNIEAREKAAKSSMALEKVKELTDEMADADYNLYLQEQELARITADKTAAEEELTRLLADRTLEENELGMALQDVYMKQDALNQEEEKVKADQIEYNKVIEESQAAIDSLTEYIGEEADAQSEAAVKTQTNTEAMSEQEKAAAELASAIEKETEKLADNLAQQATSFDSVIEASKQSKDEILKNLEENQQAVTEWAENIQTLMARGINDGILQELANMGPARRICAGVS